MALVTESGDELEVGDCNGGLLATIMVVDMVESVLNSGSRTERVSPSRGRED